MYSKIPGANEDALTKGPALTSPGKPPLKASPNFMKVSWILRPNTLLLRLTPGSAGHCAGSPTAVVETARRRGNSREKSLRNPHFCRIHSLKINSHNGTETVKEENFWAVLHCGSSVWFCISTSGRNYKAKVIKPLHCDRSKFRINFFSFSKMKYGWPSDPRQHYKFGFAKRRVRDFKVCNSIGGKNPLFKKEWHSYFCSLSAAFLCS